MRYAELSFNLALSPSRGEARNCTGRTSATCKTTTTTTCAICADESVSTGDGGCYFRVRTGIPRLIGPAHVAADEYLKTCRRGRRRSRESIKRSKPPDVFYEDAGEEQERRHPREPPRGDAAAFVLFQPAATERNNSIVPSVRSERCRAFKESSAFPTIVRCVINLPVSHEKATLYEIVFGEFYVSRGLAICRKVRGGSG